MAEDISPPAKALERVEELLKCPICLDSFNQPKFLPCHHAFCQDCLSRVALKARGKSYTLNCPLCCRPAQVPDGCIRNFPNAYHVPDLKEIQTLMKKRPTSNCPKHKSDLNIYCSDCDELICHDCIVCDHWNHSRDPISDEIVFRKHKEVIDSNLQTLQNKLAFITQKIEAFQKQMTEISKNRDRVKEEIRATGNQMIAEYTATVQQSMGQLEKKADTGAEQKLKFVNAQMRDAQKTADELQRCVEYVEEELTMGSQQILAGKRQMVDRMKVVTSQVKEEEYSTTEEANMQFNKILKNAMVGMVDFSLVVNKYRMSRKDRNNKVAFELAITHGPTKKRSPYPTTLVSCQLFIPPGATPCPTDYSIEMTSPGKYTIAFTSVTCGPHQLKVMLGDVEIPGSPFSFWIHTKRGMLRRITLSGVLSPCCSVSVGRKSIVTANEKSIHILNKQGEKTDQIKSGWSKNTRFEADRIAITQDDAHILFTSFTSHYIKKLNLADQKITDTIGSHGPDPLQFDHPLGIHVHPNGTILVADSGNHRIQVLNPDLSFSHMLGSGRRSSKCGEFNAPTDITTDISGMVYVADKRNERVQKLTLQGDFVTQFYTVYPPCSVTFDSRVGAVYVLCRKESYSSVVQVFSASGIYLGNILSQQVDVMIPVYSSIAVDTSTATLYVGNDDLESYKINALLDQLPFLQT